MRPGGDLVDQVPLTGGERRAENGQAPQRFRRGGDRGGCGVSRPDSRALRPELVQQAEGDLEILDQAQLLLHRLRALPVVSGGGLGGEELRGVPPPLGGLARRMQRGGIRARGPQTPTGERLGLAEGLGDVERRQGRGSARPVLQQRRRLLPARSLRGRGERCQRRGAACGELVLEEGAERCGGGIRGELDRKSVV